jgi:hypothetical protein
MAKFIGSVEEFHDFIGPKLRNAINDMTRTRRKKRGGVCEICEKKAELQSAHVHGRDRRSLIEKVLLKYADDYGTIQCLLEEVETRILQAHLPIEETFKFLCQPCHTRYDSNRTQPESDLRSITETYIEADFPKLSRIRLWANRPQQINHRIIRAYLSLERNGEVELSALRQYCTENLHISNFDAHYASMKTDAGNAHGKVFFNEGSKVKIWHRARKYIDEYFKLT